MNYLQDFVLSDGDFQMKCRIREIDDQARKGIRSYVGTMIQMAGGNTVERDTEVRIKISTK